MLRGTSFVNKRSQMCDICADTTQQRGNRHCMQQQAQATVLCHGNEADEDQDSRFDVWQESDEDTSDDDSVEVAVKGDSDMKNAIGSGPAAEMDRKFRVLGEGEVWEAPEGPIYDDTGAGPCNLPDDCKTREPGEVLLLLFPLVLWKNIVTQTNLYYAQCARAKREKIHRGQFVTVSELTTWVGLHMKMMSCWTGNQDDYFTDGANGSGAFDARSIMSRRRFFWIKAHLHFADKSKYVPRGQPGHDPLYYLRMLTDTFNVTFRKYWKLNRYVSLDEMMIAFKGHNPLHVYIPRKPTPNGSKIHALCDALGFYCVALLFDDKAGMSIPDIVDELLTGTLLPGQTIITDRFYSSAGLVELCLSKQIHIIASTKSQCFLAKHTLPKWTKGDAIARGTFRVAVNSDGTVANIIWKDKGIVRLTATAASSVRTYLWRREKGKKPFLVKAPWIAKLFDLYFHGVDRNDQLRGKGYGLATTFRAAKYTVKLFMGLFDIVLSNAWILWRNIHTKQYKMHRQFYRNVFDYLIHWDPLKERQAPIPSTSKTTCDHILRRLGQTKSGNPSFGTCPMCNTPTHKRKRTRFACPTCNVPLHVECAHKFHGLSPTSQGKLTKRRRQLSFESDNE